LPPVRLPRSSRPARIAIVALRAGTALLAAIATMFVGSVGVADAFPRRVPSDYVGVNGQFLGDLSPELSWSAAAPAHLDAMAAGGIEVVRAEPSWGSVEPNPPDAAGHHYVWDRPDRIVTSLAQRHLRLYGVVDYSAPWAGTQPGNFKSAPASNDDFAQFAKALAARYGTNGSFWQAHPELPYMPVHSWEIWNEENGFFWEPQPDPWRYIDLYLASRNAIRSVDPNAAAVIGGLVPQGAEGFVRAMFEHRPDAHGQIDAIGYHPYAGSADGSMALIAGFRHTLATLGEPGLPIEVTEVGWPTAGGTGSMPDDQRAAQYRLLTDQVARSDCGVTRFIPHTWVTQERDPNTVEDWFGLFHPDATPTASGNAYLEASRTLEGRGPQPAPTDTVYRCGPPPSTNVVQPRSTRITGYRVAPKVFRAAPRGRAVTARRAGARVRFRLSQAAQMVFKVQRCVPSQRRGRPCARYVAVPGSFTVRGRAGANTVRFNGRLANRTLGRAGYRLVVRVYGTQGARIVTRAVNFRVSR
jgi:polysaccharide biosynthesis protein PslG